MDKWKGPLGTARVYVYDVDTGEEIRSGLALFGRYEFGIWNGARWTDTSLGFEAVDLETREYLVLNAASFPGRRVAVKTWYGPEHVEWAALVDRARGWQGNEASDGKLTRREIGILKQVRRVIARRKKAA